VTIEKLRARLIAERDALEAEAKEAMPGNAERLRNICLAYNSVIIWTNEK
jgi:hypothetical protein